MAMWSSRSGLRLLSGQIGLNLAAPLQSKFGRYPHPHVFPSQNRTVAHLVVYLFSFVSRSCHGWSLYQKEKPFPSNTQVVVCGGGVVGASVAYHLPKYGFTDVILLEQGRYVKSFLTTG